jgi:hypothetical protein
VLVSFSAGRLSITVGKKIFIMKIRGAFKCDGEPANVDEASMYVNAIAFLEYE